MRDPWKHGKYVDLWSLIHFLSGVLLGTIFFKLGYDFSASLFLAAVSLIAWEVFEWFTGIIEPGPNVAVDVVIGFLGFFLSSFWHYHLGHPFELAAFSILVAFTGLLALWGFIDFLKRGYR